MSEEDFVGIEKNACPTVGACGGMYTANTMSSSFEALGMSLLGSSQLASPDPEKADSAADSARVLVEAIKNRSEAARHRHAQVDRERGCAHHGDRRLDERRAALSRDRARGRDQVVDRRLRAHAQESAGAVRSQAFRTLRRGRFPSRGRRAAGAQDAARERAAARRLHDDHRAHARAGAEERPDNAARRSGRDPALVESAVRRRATSRSSKATSRPKAASRRSPD